MFAGEEWARLLDGEEVESLIRAPTSGLEAHRFALLREEGRAADSLRPLLADHSVEVVEFADFDERTFSAQAVDLEVFMGTTLPPAHEFDPKRFSAGELWFHSV
jgi:hypothetical protein